MTEQSTITWDELLQTDTFQQFTKNKKNAIDYATAIYQQGCSFYCLWVDYKQLLLQENNGAIYKRILATTKARSEERRVGKEC